MNIDSITESGESPDSRGARVSAELHDGPHSGSKLPPRHPFARCRSVPLIEVAAEPFISLTREDYPNYYDLLSVTFSKVKQKPRIIEKHDSFAGVISAVEAGTGVAIAADYVFSFGKPNKICVTHA